MKLPQVVFDKIAESLPDNCKNVTIQRTNIAPDGRQFWKVRAEVWLEFSSVDDSPGLDVRKKAG